MWSSTEKSLPVVLQFDDEMMFHIIQSAIGTGTIIILRQYFILETLAKKNLQWIKATAQPHMHNLL